MSSPVRLDAGLFELPNYPVNRFIPLGQQRGNKGITHTVFLNRSPINTSFFVGDQTALSGYCAYRFLYNNNKSLLCGILFLSSAIKSVCSDYTLSVGNSQEIPDAFEPSFVLENSGIILFKGTDSSILAIPSEIESSMLIKTE